MKRILLTAALAALMWPAAARVDLGRYVVVYPASAEAEEGLDVAEAVVAAVGLDLPVVSDETPATAREILVGKTNRKESAAFYAAGPDTFDWALSRKGNKVLVSGGGCWALMRSVQELAGGVPAKPVRGNIYGECIFPREEGSNLRILDDNIWDYGKPANAPAWEGTGFDCRDEVRVRALLEVVWATRPDVVTLQEYSSHMDPLFRPAMEEAGYRMAYMPGEIWNHTPIYYHPGAVTLVETRYHRYEPKAWSNHGSKSYNWAHFTHRATGRDFLVINTHLWWKSEKACPGSDAARAAQVRKMMTEADDFVFTSGGPVFMTGDMNCRLSSPAMQQLLTAGYVPVWQAATVFGDLRNGHHFCFAEGFSRADNGIDDGTGSIDQFFLYNPGGTEVKTFHRLYAWFLVPVTDHYPNYADIRL